MAEFIMLMHRDVTSPVSPGAWEPYFATLRAAGGFDGGSGIGDGVTLRKSRNPGPPILPLGGYVRIQADNLEAAKALVAGNPVYECGGTVEVRELPRG